MDNNEINWEIAYKQLLISYNSLRGQSDNTISLLREDNIKLREENNDLKIELTWREGDFSIEV